MKRLLVNDALNQLGEVTFWTLLQEWFNMEFLGGPFDTLAQAVDAKIDAAPWDTSLIVRNCSWFPPLKASARVPTISLLQDIIPEGPQRKMQEEVIKSSSAVVFNSEFTKSKYVTNWTPELLKQARAPVIPLPVDFSLFEPGNPMGLQQALGLPDGCICWIGASQGAAGHIKGFDVFLSLVRQNPDLNFVGVFKDAAPEVTPPNMRVYVRLPHEELVKVIGACRVGLCTSRTESQHLAGIEMGGVGLPLVVPPVGAYWKRGGLPGILVKDPTVSNYAIAVREALTSTWSSVMIREHWQRSFDKPIIRAQWERLICEVEKT